MATLRGEPVDRPAVSFYEIGGWRLDPDNPEDCYLLLGQLTHSGAQHAAWQQIAGSLPDTRWAYALLAWNTETNPWGSVRRASDGYIAQEAHDLLNV